MGGFVGREKFTTENAIMKEHNRIISAQMALDLIRCENFAEARVYKKPFLELKRTDPEELAYIIEPAMKGEEEAKRVTEAKRVAKELIDIAKVLSKRSDRLSPEEINSSYEKLGGIGELLSLTKDEHLP